MKLTTKMYYGVRAVFDLAYFNGNNPTLIKDVAKRQEIPLKYLEQIFNKLKKANILNSKRGPHGGYVLARDPGKITLGDIIRATEGPPHIVFCTTATGAEKKCSMKDRCVTSQVWMDLDQKINSFFDSISIADLCERGSLLGIKQVTRP